MISKKERSAKYFQKKKRERPWLITLHNARCRCLYKSTRSFDRYGGRGIRCFLTEEQIKKLWFMDKANTMKCASIDRINNNGDYTYKNCRFIEKSENTLRKPVYRPKDCVSKYLGVCRGRYGKWLSQLQVNNRKIWIGEFETELKAHKAYLKKKAEISKKLDK